MKYEHHNQYTPEDTERAESALLTVWAVLEQFRDDLVLIGGLVPRYICRPEREELQPVTMDVDIGVALALSSFGSGSPAFINYACSCFMNA